MVCIHVTYDSFDDSYLQILKNDLGLPWPPNLVSAWVAKKYFKISALGLLKIFKNQTFLVESLDSQTSDVESTISSLLCYSVDICHNRRSNAFPGISVTFNDNLFVFDHIFWFLLSWFINFGNLDIWYDTGRGFCTLSGTDIQSQAGFLAYVLFGSMLALFALEFSTRI